MHIGCSSLFLGMVRCQAISQTNDVYMASSQVNNIPADAIFALADMILTQQYM